MTSAAMPKGTASDPPSAPVGAGDGDNRQIIETRFGQMEFSNEQALYMPRGVLGFAEHRNFGLAYLPNKFIEQLMLLQSLDSAETSFLVLPVSIDAGVIEQEDLEAVCNTMKIEPENAVFAVIVTIRDVGGQPQISVNLRAPIVFDSETRNGWQYVLPNSKYAVRHVLTGADG